MSSAATSRVTVIDSHTAGEPTRVVIAGGPDLGSGSLAARRERFQHLFDRFRSAIVNEPRGSDVIVGALLVEPEDKSCTTGVIFFNNVGCLNMCGHGTIGLIVTLAHLGRITSGTHRIETPVGIVTATLHPNGEVSVTNVPSWRAKKSITVNVPGVGLVTGDVAWGGNWFFLVEKHGLELALANVDLDFGSYLSVTVRCAIPSRATLPRGEGETFAAHWRYEWRWLARVSQSR